MCHVIGSFVVVLACIAAAYGDDLRGLEISQSTPVPLPLEPAIDDDAVEPPNAEMQRKAQQLEEVLEVFWSGWRSIAGIENEEAEALVEIEVAAPVMMLQPFGGIVFQAAQPVDANADDVATAVVQGVNNKLLALGAQLNLLPVDKDQLQQVQQALRPAMVTELEFVRHTCNLSVEQRPRIRKAAEAGLKLASRKLLDRNRLEAQGVALPGVKWEERDPQQIIRKKMSKVMNETLTTEQKGRYQDELALGQAFRRQTIALNAVSQLDELLRFTVEQREAILQSVIANFRDDWESFLDTPFECSWGVPDVVDETTMKTQLTPAQRRVWKGLQKFSPNMWMADNVLEMVMIEDIEDSMELDEDWWAGKTP